MITFDAHEVAALAVDLGRTGAAITPAMIDVFSEGANDLVKDWAARARVSSGVHGKHYPDSIDSEMQISTSIVFEIGPNPMKPQGSMAFESGSVNQPPHPDGQQAADALVPQIEHRALATLAVLGL